MTLFANRISRTLTVATLVSMLGLAALAQETADEAPVAATTEASEEQPTSVFNMGEAVDENGDPVAPEPQEPQPGEQYLREVFTDWALRCLKVEEGKDPCQM